MRSSARDPAESTAQLAALGLAVGLSLMLLAAKITKPAGHATHGFVDQVQISVVAPPKDQPAPEPKLQKRAPRPVHPTHRVARAVPVRHVAPLDAAPPQPVTDPPPYAPPAEPPAAAPVSAGRPDANLAYEAALKANITARTCGPDTPEYRLLQPTGMSRVGFTVSRDGTVSDVGIATSSGSTMLDRQAYAIVSGGVYPRMPADAFAGEANHPFLVEIEFRRGGGCASRR